MAGKALAHLQHKQAGQPSTDPSLTWREREVLKQIARGAHDREIAAAMVVAETTVKTHVRNILRKLGARNRAEAAARLRIGQSD